MKQFKRTLASILAFALVLSLMAVPSFAGADSITSLSDASVEVDGSSAKTVTVNWTVNSATTVYSFQIDDSGAPNGDLTTSLAGGKITLTSIAFGPSLTVASDYALTNGYVIWVDDNGDDGVMSAGDTLVSMTYTVAADTPAGSYPITLNYKCWEDDDNGPDATGTVTATITVTEPSAGPVQPDWEIYYTLNKTADADNDKYIEYDPGDSVVVTVYLKAKSADVLQAFDFYVENDANLEYKSYTSEFGTRIGSGTAASTATSQHIQAVGSDEDNPIDVPMAANTEYVLATLTFEVKSDAVYDTEMDITLINPSFAVELNPANFVPAIQSYASDTLGVETLKTYTVTYDGNGGGDTVTNVPTDNQTKQHGVDMTVLPDTTDDAQKPAREGYTFQGWNTAADGSGDSYQPTGTYSANADATMYAQWDAHKYTVTWKTQDGATTYETDENVPYGTVLSYDGSAPTKEADAQYTYTFAGWSETANAETGAEANTFTMGDADMVLYAAFRKVTNTYTVTWYTQDGNTAIETDTTVPYGTAPSFNSTEPTKDADETYTYTFAGWATSENQESGAAVADLPIVDGNENYYAAFSKKFIDYGITYTLGEHPAEGQTAPTDPASAHYNDKITLPAGPTAAQGYTFTGWSDGNTTYSAGADYTVTGAVTLTAQYSENHYTVHYDINAADATGTVPADKNLAYTDSYTIEAGTGLARTGYTFAGWNTAANGLGTSYSADATVSKLSYTDGATITLYAQWTTAAYVITYDLKDGNMASGYETANPTAYDVEDLPITLTAPVKTGYDFAGWTIELKTAGDGNVTTNSDSDTLMSGTWGDLKITANWTAGTVNYTVKHWQQNVDDDNYTEVTADEETLTGTTGEQTEALAGSYDGFTPKAFEQATIAADGSTVVNIYYDRDLYTLTYTVTYDGVTESKVGVTPPAATDYRYGKEVTVSPVLAKQGYVFTGWKLGTDDAPATVTMNNNVTLTGVWTADTVSYTVEHYQADVDGSYPAAPTETETESGLTESQTTAEAKDYVGFNTPNTVPQEEILPDGSTVVKIYYTRQSYDVTYAFTYGTGVTASNITATAPATVQYVFGAAVTVDDTAYTQNGYTFGGWQKDGAAIDSGSFTMPASAVAITGEWTANSYTITFDTDGGTAIAPMTYTIESTDNLPSATGKTFFEFQNWKVTTADGNWAADAIIDGGTAVTGKYGNVTLTAQWTQALNYEVQEYKYAPVGYKLLIIDAASAGDGNVFTYDSATMYYTTDANYQIGASTGVFYTLIPAAATTLSDAEVGKIAASVGTRAAITYDGDVNGDGKLTIADANAIFQMVVNTGSYYTDTQLTIEQRLAADMVKATDNAEYRGSIEDVNAVVAIINGTN